MSPASHQAAPPRDADGLATFRRSVLPTHQSGKRDSNPRPQPWQGCALPTELFPRGRNLTAPVRGDHPESDGRTVGHSDRESFAVSGRPSDRPTVRPSGGEGDRTPDLVNAIHALSQLSYAPCILGPGKTRSGGNTASYRGVLMVSSDRAPWHELSGVWPVSQDVPGPIAMAKHMRRKKTTSPARAKPRAVPPPPGRAPARPPARGRRPP